MKLFIYEHLTAGGEGSAPSSLRDEGMAMLHAAMRDFSGVSEAFTIADPRFIRPLEVAGEIRPIKGGLLTSFALALEECDCALIIAPETGGALARLTAMAAFRGVRNLGCGGEAIIPTGNKLHFSRLMEEIGVAHPRTFQTACFFDSSALEMGRWIAKPADGAGCLDARLYNRGERASMPGDGSVIVQEYIEGEPMSACVISGSAGPAVASINRQFIHESKGMLEYRGGEVTEAPPSMEVNAMVNKIWEAIPGLSGFWGIDYISAKAGPVAIEVNPRLTTSYCALKEALGINPANLIMKAANGERLPQIASRKRVRFDKRGGFII